jgi:ABC-type siderophore export system fused ATPase/permease subunit
MTTVIFFSSATLIVLFLTLKYIERRRNGRFFEKGRKQLDDVTLQGAQYLAYRFPHLVALRMVQMAISVADTVMERLHAFIHMLEKELHDRANNIHGRRKEIGQRAASEYLAGIVRHKEEVNGNRQNGYYEK